MDNKIEKFEIGKLGEEIAAQFLKEKDFLILERNYKRKWGELDIISKKQNKIHFIEVKSVSCEIINENVIHETKFEPEDSIQNWKIQRLKRAIQSFLLEKNIFEQDWQFDIISVFVDQKRKKAKMRFIENMIL